MPDPQPPFHYSIPEEEIDEHARASAGNPFTRMLGPAKWFVGLAIVILGLMSLVGWQLFGSKQGDQPATVVLQFDAKTDATSGSATEFSFLYENRDSHALKNVHLEILYPEGFRFLSSSVASREGTGRNFDFDELPPGSSGKIVINGIFMGIPQETKLLQAKIYYQLDNSTAQFSAGTEVRINLLAPDFNLRVLAPAQVISSQKIEYAISYQNISDQTLNRAQLRVELPEGFEFASSSLPTLDRKVWDLGTLAPSQEGALIIRGRLTGPIGNERVLKAELGYQDNASFVLQNRAYFTSRIIESPLKVSYESSVTNSIAEEGDTLNLTINYVNTGTEGIHNVRLGIRFAADTVDFKTARPEGGALVGHDFLWNASSKSQLALIQPGEQGSFRLKISVRRDLAQQRIVNPEVRFNLYSSADEFAEPIFGADQQVKIRSRALPEVQISYVSGPQPPQVDEDSLYRITLKASSSFNDLSDVSLAGFLNIPFVVMVDGTVEPIEQNSAIIFVESSGRLTWRVGDLPAFSEKQISLLVRVRTSAGSNFTLPVTKSLEIVGTNVFTSEKLVPGKVEDKGIKIN